MINLIKLNKFCGPFLFGVYSTFESTADHSCFRIPFILKDTISSAFLFGFRVWHTPPDDRCSPRTVNLAALLSFTPTMFEATQM